MNGPALRARCVGEPCWTTRSAAGMVSRMWSGSRRCELGTDRWRKLSSLDVVALLALLAGCETTEPTVDTHGTPSAAPTEAGGPRESGTAVASSQDGAGASADPSAPLAPSEPSPVGNPDEASATGSALGADAAAHVDPARDANGPGELGPDASSAVPSELEITLEVCVDYVMTQCRRLLGCDAQSAADVESICRELTLPCPDLLSAPGNTRDLEDVVACTAEWSTFSCDRINADERPECAAAGTRAAGESCIFRTQCQSGTCSSNGAGCGVCYRMAEEGEACTSSVRCGYGETCDAAGQCVPSPPPPTGETYADAAQGTGEPCFERADCGPTDYCDLSSDRCEPLRAVGEDCATNSACGGVEQFCSQLSGTCAQPAPAGSPCDFESATYIGRCAEGAVCDHTADPPVCRMPPVEGEPCIRTAVPPAHYCAEGFVCSTSSDPPICRVAEAGAPSFTPITTDGGVPIPSEPRLPVGMAGEACTVSLGCAAPFECLCTTPACEQRRCANYAFMDEPCGRDDTVCHPASECVGGQCVATGYQRLFETTCER